MPGITNQNFIYFTALDILHCTNTEKGLIMEYVEYLPGAIAALAMAARLAIFFGIEKRARKPRLHAG